ncbi:MAG: tRNA (adenosine(37)-N6)-threonylcarbamoyltransferase complex dimerization subunit type 1 TsaB [Candidatus Omnitrophica bacterium]|nr:tRNA (adenosine(37)-N6)-threonylcarbamoyltransferase complex dimerization subunit type 1 TsaB [Candidatus Omnitrophota bacterium]
MKILSVDTSTSRLCIGIAEQDREYLYEIEIGRRLSEVLIPTIQRITKSIRLNLKDFDYFCCGRGPGSFTGVRIGMATLKGFSWALKKPLVGVVSLDILANNANNKARFSVPLIDARRNLLYTAIYKNISGLWKRIGPYLLISQDDLVKNIHKTIEKKFFGDIAFFGDGLIFAKDLLQREFPEAQFLDKDYWFMSSYALLKESRQAILGKRIGNTFTVLPLYLYPKECQVRIK